MGIPHYLAMTGAELARNPPYAHTAWLACHFSPYNDGLSNLPSSFPPRGLLVLDDATPMENHDPQVTAGQLSAHIERLDCAGLLLDFQRRDTPGAMEMVAHLVEALPCPVGASHLYAQGLDCPVFLPPAPLHSTLEGYLQPWEGREVWMETALEGEVLTLTKDGCTVCPAAATPDEGFLEEKLHCHHSIETGSDFARFTLWRTREDLDGLLAEAETLGVTLAVGLWQELHG